MHPGNGSPGQGRLGAPHELPGYLVPPTEKQAPPTGTSLMQMGAGSEPWGSWQQDANALTWQDGVQNGSGESHCSPGSTTPLPHVTGGGSVVVVVDVEVDAVVEVTDVEVEVGGATHPLLEQASQQLEKPPTHALVPPDPRQLPAARLIRQRVPRAVVRQHVTAPGRPHVERAAHRSTSRRHARGSSALPRTTADAQRM